MKDQERRQRDELRRGVSRRRQQEEEGSTERSLAQNLGMVGSLGWLIVIPTLLGVWLGRWLDRQQESGVLWTGALLTVGLVLGCWLAWHRMHEA